MSLRRALGYTVRPCLNGAKAKKEGRRAEGGQIIHAIFLRSEAAFCISVP